VQHEVVEHLLDTGTARFRERDAPEHRLGVEPDVVLRALA
jgi:hypothetical protein